MSESRFFHQNRWFQRFPVTLLLAGQVFVRLLRGKLQRAALAEQLGVAGPRALGTVLLMSGLAGMICVMQMGRELIRYGAIESMGGAFALAFCRELGPLLTAGIVAGQVGGTYAAEVGVMQITEQIDALHMLRTNPVDYLVTPRVVACCVMVPILTTFAITIGLGSGALVAYQVYGQPPDLFLNSVRFFLTLEDLWAIVLKAVVFGVLVSLIGCSWGLTTRGGAKGVGQSTTAAVVNIWVAIFLADLVLSLVLAIPPIPG
ncbi:MlaE family lipid ABC transporter permease subunit [Prochlorothrix hollandica]|uniref:MlaE family lipid ABC transporter permease subunit n=1 Tax=Prochlorothrix hollandica TaxID=1223 RepID=UPI00333E4CD8